MRHGIFADHNRVIDNDAEGHDEREQADHVDRTTVKVQHAKRRQKRGWDADGHPAGSARIEKEIQNQDHQHQS